MHEITQFQPAMSMQQAVDRFNAVADFARQVLKQDIDFGVVPGSGGKPTLYKPGAEKLTTFFGLSVHIEAAEIVEDWTGANHGGEAFFYYRYRCRLFRDTLLVAEADASCNSWEKKYRWRQADRRCPACGAATIKRSKQAPKTRPNDPPGWYCFSRIGGCGTNYDAAEPAIVGQAQGRVPNEDVCDQVNTIQKMAQKRALVAAVLIAVNASEFFTQDIEDLVFEVAPASPGASFVESTTNDHRANTSVPRGTRPQDDVFDDEDAPPVCPIHGVPMVPSRRGGHYHWVRATDGDRDTACNGQRRAA